MKPETTEDGPQSRNPLIPGYRGRFAPSPTGPLHFGSLVAAVGSYLSARTTGGQWLVRIEDLDPPREQPGAADSIIRTLAAYGMEWDGEILYQSSRAEAYREAAEGIRSFVYPCTCSRKEIAQTAVSAREMLIYPGTCRLGPRPGRRSHSLRLVTEGTVGFEDQVQGAQSQDLETDVGDFVIRRADGLYAYQLAVVVDDAEQGITHVVRGADLLDSTARQIYLQRLLGLPTPRYAHLPVAADRRGHKLSKQTRAAPLDDRDPVPALWRALHFLGQQPPSELQQDALANVWHWALGNFRLERVPRVKGINVF